MTTSFLIEKALLDKSKIKINFTPVLFITGNMKYCWSQD
jgi:hypothetical protein